ncbi:PVC-type heme-binding CxxCH protein [Haloferula chungangensis]|uniref:PVC-type heme-binding CxxCH protein n=1 Tax=Haloferula chungangensis TaxID=1048331 RepID=A0ABW2L629_9BACT
MKLIPSTLLASILSCGAGIAVDTTGIKSANLQGADVTLMTNHDPASELENFTILPGYEANLFASEPMIANPVHMQWDSKGRLWVACSWTYPQVKPGQKVDDKIIILEDTDNDGRADKSTVFADGLYLPTGIELANGGCYVGQSPDVLFLKDTDGDDVADERTLALTGFGIEDSHHSISAWRRGPGGWIYFQEGLFLHTQVETQRGMVRNVNGGIYQYNPRTEELRVFSSGAGGNPWGHVFDQWGQSFMVNNPKILYISPTTGNSGEAVRIKPLITTSKQCGGDLASGSHIGDDLQGQLLTGRFKSRSVVRYEFIEDGAGFNARVLDPLIESRHPNFRPVDVKMGPDGAIYIADWYNSIINHANHDFRDPRRDHDHGRIWRITKTASPLVEKPKLTGLTVKDLVGQLDSPEPWTRHQARKELSERDPDEVLAAAEAWIETLDVAAAGYPHHLIEAMWACQNVERISERILMEVIASDSGHARSAAARILRYWHAGIDDPLALVAKLSADPFPRTRMEAVLSAGFIPNAAAFAAALHALDGAKDPLVDMALEQTDMALAKYWRPAMEAGELEFAKDSHRAYAESMSGIGFGKRLTAYLENPSAGVHDAIKAQFIDSANDEEAAMVLKAVTEKGFDRDATVALLEALREIAGSKTPSRRVQRLTSGLKGLLSSPDEEIVVLAIQNLGAWKSPRSGAALLELLESSSGSANIKQASAVALARLGKGAESEKLLVLSKSSDLKTRYAAICGLIEADTEAGVDAMLAVFTEDPGDEDPLPLLQAILSQRKGANVLSSKLREVELHPAVVSKLAAYHRSTGQLPSSVAGFFKDSGNSLSATLLAEDQEALVADVVKRGDPYRGEMVYRRKEISCTSCHAIGSAGAQIGPNLVAIGSSATPGYMVESILQPDAAIAEHYENKLITMKDGSVRMGVVTFQSDKELQLLDSAQGKEIRLPVEDVARQQDMPSLMPAGLADQLESRQDFLDLAKFLSVLGRSGDFAEDESPVIRKWRLTAAPSNSELPDTHATWTTAYSKVNGELPAEELAAIGEVFARGAIEVLTAGEATLDISSTVGLRLWVDGKEVADLKTPFFLERGRHEVTFRIDTASRGDQAGLRVEVMTPPASPLKFQVEGGV